MINQIHMGRMNPSSFSMINGDRLGMSETGEFDFLNYLLGLQTDSTIADIGIEDGVFNPIDSTKNLTDSDQALLEVFDKKEQEKNSLLTGQAYSGNPLMSLQQPKIEGPLPSEGKGQVEWATVENFQKKESSKTRPELGGVQLEDPLTKVAFEAALRNQSQQTEKTESAANRNIQPGMVQQRGKQVQAFNAMNRDFSRVYESLPAQEKPLIDKASFDSLPSEGVEKPRKKSTEPLEFGLGDSSLDTSNRVDTIQIKEVQSNKISHVPVPEVFHKVESMVHQGGGKMTLVLSPPELGQVEIHVSTKGKNVEVSVKSDNDFAKMAIEGQVADLQQSLQSQDLNLSKIEVHVSREMDPSFMENQYSGFSRQGNFHQQPEGYRQESSSRTPWRVEAPEMNRPNLVNINRANARWTDSRVDIRI